MSSQYVRYSPVVGGGGSGVTSINGETGPALTIAAGTGISVTTLANVVTIDATGSGANTSLSNLSSLAINAALIFGTGTAGAMRTPPGAPDSNTMSIRSGNAIGGISGDSTFSTGIALTLTGSTSILTGNASGGNSGGITLQTGTASGTRGNILLNAPTISTTGNITTTASGTYSIGTSGSYFTNVHSHQFNAYGQGLFRAYNSTGSEVVRVSADDGNTTPSGESTPGAIFSNINTDTSSLNSRSSYVYTKNDTVSNANSTGAINLETGNKTAGTGNSGGITLRLGTSAGGTRGQLKIIDGTQGTAGDVWTSTDTLGNGAWATPSGGSAPTSRITLDTFNGFGSTNTAQMIFLNITDNSGGADLSYATASTGDTITINTTGMYSIVMNTSSAGADDCGYGILINASATEMQTFPFLAIPTHRLAYGYIPVSAATILSCSGTQYLTAGDVVTFCQFSNTIANPVASSYVQVTITRVN